MFEKSEEPASRAYFQHLFLIKNKPKSVFIQVDVTEYYIRHQKTINETISCPFEPKKLLQDLLEHHPMFSHPEDAPPLRYQWYKLINTDNFEDKILLNNQNEQTLTVDKAGYYACKLTDYSPFHVFIVGFTPLIWCPESELVATLGKPMSPIVCTVQAFPLPYTSWEKQNDRGHGRTDKN